MKLPKRTSVLVLILAAVSASFYLIDFLIYRNARDMGFYTLLDLAFIPINVIIVGLVINGLLESRGRDEMLHKMNMVVGAFFSEVGGELIGRLMAFDADLDSVRPHMLFGPRWTAEDYDRHRRAVAGDAHPMSMDRGDIEALRVALLSHRSFVLGLLQNGNLLEHASFTDMLWAVSHLAEELNARGDLCSLPESDARHIEGDMGRAYGRLLAEQLLYTRHLQQAYPYLFSFATRTNPFDQAARIEVGG